jgi:L-rhamnose mutarotase
MIRPGHNKRKQTKRHFLPVYIDRHVSCLPNSHNIFFVGVLNIIMSSTITLPATPDAQEKHPPRYGSVIRLRAEKLAEYKMLHASIWPAVAKAVRDARLRNYSIYLRKLPDGNYYLFSYFEYVGDNFLVDMAKLATNPEVKRWWNATNLCQAPLSDRQEGEWWASMEEIFHQD